MNRFRFLNVGQGLFYSAKLDCDFNFVFDCGSETSNANYYLNNCIQNEFRTGDCCDLFIFSHLNHDYINGLKELKKHVEVKNIHVPYLGENPVFIQCYLALLCMDSRGKLDKKLYSEIHDFYLNADNTLKDHYYRPAPEIYWTMDDFARKDMFNSDICTIKETIKLKNGWEIILFDRFITEDVEERIFIQCEAVLGGSNIVDYSEKFGLLRILQIFTRALKDKEIDKFATVVLHRPSKDYYNMTLLTGDIVMDESMINSISKATMNKLISYFQVPYHGSKVNWEAMGELRNKGINYYISFGLGNAMKHPTSIVLNELVENRKSCGLSYQFSTPYFYWNEYFI